MNTYILHYISMGSIVHTAIFWSTLTYFTLRNIVKLWHVDLILIHNEE